MSLTPPLVPKAELVTPPVSPFLGLYADVNMHLSNLEDDIPQPCLDPSEIMSDSLSMYCHPLSPALMEVDEEEPMDDRWLSPAPVLHPDSRPDAAAEVTFPEDAINAIVAILKSSAVKIEPEMPARLLADLPATWSYIKPEEIVAFVPAPEPMAPVPTWNPPTWTPVEPQEPIVPVPPSSPQLMYPETPEPSPLAPPPPPPAEPSSPVLNAHVGVSIGDLRRRATDFRLRNQGKDLDKTFLQCFAGRLSARGELLEDYRCYVTGCGQRNKRRDHILVHVGSHVEHRPWACSHCGMKFLRKNECKRHESSHGGRKPFACPLCTPFGDRSFVRQDLLKRHLRVSHGVNEVGSRKRGSAKKEALEAWP
ncbi:uncharacterized protein BXZ73DRAFT_53114 [Epithele typhae]|uniref:uncharacterized protein n=1 Tax=Epithele typhae TaxID=378194 RepID=UPI002007ACE8|nr:uncharacterized protein BXZ73DRAFT_53114 [Epithele typhae]KAH9918238.1 hypothetical protein BXZ73DRAFT_53114 [Epithele typhae]